MAQGEYFDLRCFPPPYGTDNTANNYSCINPPNLCNGFIYTSEKCNVVSFVDAATMLVNDDYSLDFTVPIPTNSSVYTLDWYTCEGWLNPAYASSVPTPDLSEVTISISASSGSGTGTVNTQNTIISITDPAELAVVGGNWTYTTDPCQCNGYGEYRISVILKWDYASSPVIANNFACWSDAEFYAGWGDRPVIGLLYSLAGEAGGGTTAIVGGTLTPYDTAAGCALMPPPNTNGNGRPRRNRIR